MRVVHLTPSFLPIIGGTEYYVARLMSSLNKYKVYSEVISFCKESRLKSTRTLDICIQNGEKSLIWPSHPFGMLRLLFRAHFLPFHRDALREYLAKFDIIHIHDDVDLSFSLITRKLGIPKIFTCHSLPYWLTYYRVNPLARKLFVISADCYHTFTFRDKQSLGGLGISMDKVKVVPHGVDVKMFRPVNTHMNKKYIHVGFLGRISRNKGIIYLLNSLKILEKLTNKPFKVSIGGPISDWEYYSELLRYKEKNRLTNVHVVGPVQDTVSFYNQLDIFVFPSIVETFGLTLLEAMACGIPVVASKINPVDEIVQNGSTGLLFEPKSPEDLAKKLYDLISNTKLRRKMGTKARRMVENHYSMEKHAEAILNIYCSLSRR